MSELSKIQNPQFKPNLEVISLSNIIEDVMKKVDYFVSVKQLNVQSNIKHDVQILVILNLFKLLFLTLFQMQFIIQLTINTYI